MDLALAHIEVYALVCGNAVGINFRDPFHLHNEFVLRHWLFVPSFS